MKNSLGHNRTLVNGESRIRVYETIDVHTYKGRIMAFLLSVGRGFYGVLDYHSKHMFIVDFVLRFLLYLLCLRVRKK